MVQANFIEKEIKFEMAQKMLICVCSKVIKD